jgi:hypothetical protein
MPKCQPKPGRRQSPVEDRSMLEIITADLRLANRAGLPHKRTAISGRPEPAQPAHVAGAIQWVRLGSSLCISGRLNGRERLPNRSSRREEALRTARGKFEPPHVGCYAVHGRARRPGRRGWRCQAAWWRSWSSKPVWGSTKSRVGSIPIHLRQNRCESFVCSSAGKRC